MPDTSQTTMPSFVEYDVPELTLLDRTTGERFATCPAQGRLMLGVQSTSFEAESGIQAHDVLSEAIKEYVASGGAITSAHELVDVAMGAMLNSRPDVQPDVIDALRPCVWEWSKFIVSLHPANILRFDGGTGARSGQLAHDIPSLGVRATAELDLLHAGPSKSVLHEYDYKTGQRHWTAADVVDAFQFQFHALLVLMNYPEVDCLETTIWNTRFNKKTYVVEFPRSKLPQYEARVYQAAKLFAQYRDAEPAMCPTWPTITKCGMCDAAKRCHASATTIDADPQAFAAMLIAKQAQLDALMAEAAAYVDRTGRDIVLENGDAFGRAKPTTERKKPAGIYQLKGA